MSFFRSEEILHKKLRLPGDVESAVKVLDSLGNLSEDCLQFIDLTQDNLEEKKNFYPMITRCETLIQISSQLETLCDKFKIKHFPYTHYSSFKNDILREQEMRQVQPGAYFDILENELIELDKQIQELMHSYQQIKEDLQIEYEKKKVFEKYKSLIQSSNLLNESIISNNSVFDTNNNNINALSFIIGVVKAEDDLKMKRMIFRGSKGTAIANFFNFDQPNTSNTSSHKVNDDDNNILKKIFVIFYPSDGKEVLRNKLLHICDIFNASRYQPYNNEQDNVKAIQELAKEIRDKKNILHASKKEINNVLNSICGSEVIPGKISLYKLYFKKMKMIYENLSKCIHNKNFIDGEVWIISKNYPLLKQNLASIQNDNFSNGTFIDLIESNITKPTYIRSNTFTNTFQYIVNTYGVPRYQEINPAYFNIVFFPFLFAMMFGDIGHGSLLVVIALYLILKKNHIISNKTTSLFASIVDYRYFILLMGTFSVFCGFIYNDFIGVPFHLFKSCYQGVAIKGNNIEAIKHDEHCTYPFGIDSKWYSASNELAFTNSIKMKLSVIFGVMQMIFGIVLKGVNDVYFNKWLAFVFEFIPQIIFMCLLFGYMVVMIFMKWSVNWNNEVQNPPSIITHMINIFLKFGSVSNEPLWGKERVELGGNVVYQQEQFHKAILIICIILVPIMFLPKPIIQYIMLSNKVNRRKRGDAGLEGNQNVNNEEEEHSLLIDNESSNRFNNNNNVYYSHLHQDVNNEHYSNLMNLLVNQLIETIEFVLSTISNTASYLRLWALSLAHSQLSKIFLEKLILNIFNTGDFLYGMNIIKLMINYFLFAHITLFVLMFMDLMECFLHTLRLHWVEFQNKFFKADGYLFIPFTFKYLINEA